MGASDWLAGNHDLVVAALPDVPADARTELATTIGRFKLHQVYLDLLIEMALGSSKKARAGARQALTGADRAALASALRKEFSAATTSRKSELVELTAATLGDHAAPLLSEWGSGETPTKVRDALNRVLSSSAPTVAPATTDTDPGPSRADGPDGYLGVDGTWVAPPPLEPLPQPGPIPPDVLRLLGPAMAEFNRKLAAAKIEAQDIPHYHWSKHLIEKSDRDLDELVQLASGTHPIDLTRDRRIVHWLTVQNFQHHPAVAQFFSGLPLHHLVRLGVVMSNGHFAQMISEWSLPVGEALQQRLANGADLRTVLALWRNAGGGDFIAASLSARWAAEEMQFGSAVWPVLCSYFTRLDEALGLVPQSGGAPPNRDSAFQLLAMFPKLPARYRGPLMLLSGDSSSTLRTAARTLLQDTPGIGGAIALQLQDGRQETRALAAEWLAARNDVAEAPAIRKAIGKERSEVARAAMITALERFGEDVSDYFDTAAMIKEAKAGLAKARPKGLEWLPLDRLPSLKWKDGSPVDPQLVEWWVVLATKLKQPGGNALMNLWLDRLAPGDAHRLGWMVLTGWIDEDTRTPTEEEANAYAAQNVDALLQHNIGIVKKYPQYAGQLATDRDVIFAGLKLSQARIYVSSGADSKGVLALAVRVNGADAAQRVRSFLKDHGQRVAQAKALVELLAAIGSRPALQVVLSAANRSKQRSLQAYAAELIEGIADRNGWTAAQLADRTIPTGGFDNDGTQELDCGENRLYRLKLDAEDAVVIVNAEGREVKALPAARTDEERPLLDAAKKQFTNARKEVKQVLAAQTERLHEAMCLGRGWDRGEWETFIAGHAIVGRLAARLVWQGVDADGKQAATFRPLGDGSYTDAADGSVSVAHFATVRLAHSSLLDPATVAVWRKHLADYAVEPVFDQLGRDLPKLADAQRMARKITDRAGWMIESFKLRGAATKLGYQRGPAGDGGWFATYEKSYRDAGLVAEIEFTGSPLPEENRPSALQAMSFRKLRDGRAVGQIALGDVPSVLLAECWSDLHDIAAKGFGFDAAWEKKAQI